MTTRPSLHILLMGAIVSFALIACQQDRTVRDDLTVDELRDVYGFAPPRDIRDRLHFGATDQLEKRHADPLAAITSENIANLRLAWFIQTQHPVSHQPLVDGNRVYFADWGGTVYAADLRTGEIIWSTQAELSPQLGWPIHGFVGTGAIEGDVLFLASVEGTAYALDKNTGEVLWDQRLTDQPMVGSLGSILVYDGLVYIGLSSVQPIIDGNAEDASFQGRVIALNAADGTTAWEQILVEKPHEGVGVHGGFAIDTDAGVLYFTTGRSYRGGVAPLANSLVAVDARQGSLRWAYQIPVHQAIDPDDPVADMMGPEDEFQAPPQLFQAMIGGERYYAVGAAHKNGTYYLFDRDTGDPIGSLRLGMAGPGGGMTAAASIGQNQLFLWSNNTFPMQNPAQHPMDVAAFDLSTGESIWRRPGAQPAAYNTPGFLTSDVYLVPSLDGTVRGYRATDGTTIWASDQHGGINSGLTVASGTLLFGTAVPPPLSEAGMSNGLVAYRLDMRGAEKPRVIMPPLPNLPHTLPDPESHEVDTAPPAREQRMPPLRANAPDQPERVVARHLP